ncbi:MAG: methylated-DNA--[protein]-cysteine S-methyltransferase [Clostridiales bacterium]|jgi:methylated-DNA-protein-cysteine methyltransferase-like protein|nr:methylated-DNA--[protein]-cysteine S-methyltransferase [Clostridiales bacterium]
MNAYEKIYETVRKIPKGKVSTYGDIARFSGNPHWARVVGYAMYSCDSSMGLPCHRVLNRLGETCPGHLFGGENVQRGRLEAEGVKFENGRVDLGVYGWNGLEDYEN